MGVSTKIKMLLAARNMTMTQLAQKIEPQTSLNNISGKIKRDNFSEADLLAIAKACDASFEGIFTLNDTGKSI